MPIISGPQPFLRTLDPVTGTRIASDTLSTSFNLACYPTHDGRILWLSRLTTQTVSPYDLATKKVGSTVNIGTNPVGIWAEENGRFLWKISSAGVLGKCDLATATVIETISLPASTYAGLTGGRRYLWSMDTTNVIQIDPYTGTIVDSFTKPANASDLHFDGRYLWILTGAASVQGQIRQYDPVTGTECGNFAVTNYGLSDAPTGLTGDKRYLYNTELIQ